MKVSELIELLQEFDGDQEVRVADQPNWPFKYSIGGVADGDQVGDEDHDCRGNVYLCTGRQIGYTSRDLWNLADRIH